MSSCCEVMRKGGTGAPGPCCWVENPNDLPTYPIMLGPVWRDYDAAGGGLEMADPRAASFPNVHDERYNTKTRDPLVGPDATAAAPHSIPATPRMSAHATHVSTCQLTQETKV